MGSSSSRLVWSALSVCLSTGRHIGSPSCRIVSNARVALMRKVSCKARATRLSEGLAQNARSPGRAMASILTQHLGMLGCGCTGTVTADHSFSAHGFYIYSTRRYL